MSKRLHLAILLLLAASGAASAQSLNPVVVMLTSHGAVKMELYADQAPLTVNNFLKYVDDRFYDGLIFHRVIPTFMIQGGGMDAKLKDKPGRPPIKHEPNTKFGNSRGTLALARAQNPDSGTSQFFINVKDNPFIDGKNGMPGYTVFGKVIDGMDVVDAIATTPTTNHGGHSDVPIKEVTIRSIRRANQHEFTTSGPLVTGRTFILFAHVGLPQAGQTLTLELPAGVECVEGRLLQPVAITDFGESIVTWRLRCRDVGETTVTVIGSGGFRKTIPLKIAAASNR
jgi:cyclophilin family peptidyl-prolyl cis-trans isomerase